MLKDIAQYDRTRSRSITSLKNLTVHEVELMPRSQLLALWAEVYSTPTPKQLSQTNMRRMLTFEIQSQQNGGLPKGFAERLKRAADGRTRPKSNALKPGGRLLREWNSTTHVVDITEEGYIWQGTPYKSLSAIARTITAAHWSGPRFFGTQGKCNA